MALCAIVCCFGTTEANAVNMRSRTNTEEVTDMIGNKDLPTTSDHTVSEADAMMAIDGHGILDTGCNKSVAGQLWLEDLRERLRKLGLQPHITEAHEKFNGLGGAQRIAKRC